MTRPPAVAGQFYPASRGGVERMLQQLLPAAPERVRAAGVLVPHAGWIYSGRVAATVFGSVRLPRRLVILCPNHTGRGAPLAVDPSSGWQTPLGEAEVDGELARELQARLPELAEDRAAHAREHSLEVQLPILQHQAPGFRFLPLCVGTQHLPTLLRLGEAIADTIRACPDEVLVVVSSDMTHYEPADIARQKDRHAIARLEAMDPEGLHRTVHGEGISMCGVAPAVAGLAACRRLGARRGALLLYANSGDVSGDLDQVVGYAGVVLGPETA